MRSNDPANSSNAEGFETSDSNKFEIPSGKLVAGRYHIAEIIGKGGTKVAYRSHDASLDLDVAISFVQSDSVPGFDSITMEREIEAMVVPGAHHGTVPVLDREDYRGSKSVVTQMIEAGSGSTNIPGWPTGSSAVWGRGR